MPNTQLWDKFATIDNFILAWQRTVNCSSRMMQDELGMKVFAHDLQLNLEDLLRKVQAQDYPYTPLADHKVYVPKPSTTLRTMSLMAIPDLIIYQALVNVIANCSHTLIVTHENQHVLGNLYAGEASRWMLKPWKTQYSRFIDRIEGIFIDGNPWIASTDIVAFYDTIDHERLIGLINKYCGEDERFNTLLRSCLAKWSPHNPEIKMSRGIPQGSNASDFLANLFLYDIDRELIVNGYHYVRYVDDIRILGAEKSVVQKGLIMFDLELKKAGLVAQVSKTSVHKIDDIEKEISRLRFNITDPAGDGEYILVTVPSSPKSEQAESISKYIQSTPSEGVDSEAATSNGLDDDQEKPASDPGTREIDIDGRNTENLQAQLREKLLEYLPLLEDSDRSKEADTTITFCLYRLDPDPSILDSVLNLLDRLPWRSEAITTCLSRFINDKNAIKGIKDFIAHHEVYNWHRANALWALYKIAGAKEIEDICRVWVADTNLDWYSRTISTRILMEMPAQHAFLMECLKREQLPMARNHLDTEILRQELAYGSFQRIKSKNKQLSLLKLISTDPSPLVKRLTIYLLQQSSCVVQWNELKSSHDDLKMYSDLIVAMGISPSASKPCLIADTLVKMYDVPLQTKDLRKLYSNHYEPAIPLLRNSISAYHKHPDDYISEFHKFIHLTIIGFYESVFPTETGLYSRDGYGGLVNRAVFSQTLPNGLTTWKDLGALRNRVDHPVDTKTSTHSRRIEYKEMHEIFKRLKVALAELFDKWEQALQTP